MADTRKIIHIDMDAFYASVEQLDNPELKGKPVIVGGRPDSRGVVAACSYEARAYGIRSAMPSSRAYALCPHATFLKPRMNRYREFSSRIMEIFSRYTDVIEPLSLDEAYLDITYNKKNEPSATKLAHEICHAIHRETGLTASAGVSCNKFVAKIASDINKPNGVSVITPAEVNDFLSSLPIRKFHGIGAVTEQKMSRLGIRTGADLRSWSMEKLMFHFGKQGIFFYNIVRGRDDRAVQPNRIRKSIGAEKTLAEDTPDRHYIVDLITALSTRVGDSLLARKILCHTVTLKIRYADFTTITRSTTSKTPLGYGREIAAVAAALLHQTDAGARKVRLVGVSVSKLAFPEDRMPRQIPLPFTHGAEPADPSK